MSSLLKSVINLADHLKPVVKKFIPENFLRYLKANMLSYSYRKLVERGKKAPDRNKYSDGINLIGLIRAEMGLGQSCRLLANALTYGNIPFMIYDFCQPNMLMRAQDHTYDDKIQNQLQYNINMIHINPDEMQLLYTQLSSGSWDYRYNIAFWLWELEEIPADWQKYFPLLDEIWTPSEYISRNLRKVTSLPVRTLPYWVTAETDKKYDRKYFDLPVDQFLILTMYDSNSTMERKNPMATVEAFKKAFSVKEKGVGLVLKVNNAREEDLIKLKTALAGYQNIYYITETLEKIQVNSLIECCDVFSSLHRAEGFGLVMAEAMLVGTPVIATNYSSNTEFMDSSVACMVDYTFTTLREDCPPYKKGAVWADPDVEQAAGYMRRLYQDPLFTKELAGRALDHARMKLGGENVQNILREHLSDVYAAFDVKPCER